jgi:dTDP-4-amino-4,6-dideoxygalactose transaminase
MKDDKLAIHGGKPAIEGAFPSWPIWDDQERQGLENVLKSSVWGVQGHAIPEFTRKFKELQKASYVLPVFNGTIAIVLALEALGVQPGDEVILPDYTFMATAVAPLKVFAEPVLVDVDPDTFCMDPEQFRKAVTSKTKAVIPVHFGGNICDMEAICSIAAEHGIRVIEDSAHAQGASVNGRCAGTFGDIGTFSFQSSKTLTCGEGGAVTTNSEEIFNALYSYHNCGRIGDRPDYAHHLPGSNYRLGQFQAAVLSAQIDKFPSQSELRDRNGKLLTEMLNDIEGVRPQKRAANLTRHGYYLYTFILEADIPRKAFKEALAAEGCLVQLEYPAIHTLPFMEPYVNKNAEFPVSALLGDRSVWFYHNALLGTEKQIEQTAKAVRKVISAEGSL